MAKKKTKLEKMSKKERTSLAYALATNLAKHGKPQSPTNERKLTKGEENKKEKHMGKFKKAFSLQEAHQLAKIINEGRYGGVPSASDNDPRYLYPDLFKDIPTQTKKEWVVDYMGEEVIVTAYNKGEAIRKGANIMSVPTPDTQYVKATEVTKENLKNPKKADLNKDGKLSSYEKKRGAAIEKSMQKESHTGNPNDKYVVRPCKNKKEPWAVWEGETRVKGFATKEVAQKFADKKNKEQGLK